MTPAGTSNELDVQNEWEENTHTHITSVNVFNVLNVAVFSAYLSEETVFYFTFYPTPCRAIQFFVYFLSSFFKFFFFSFFSFNI